MLIFLSQMEKKIGKIKLLKEPKYIIWLYNMVSYSSNQMTVRTDLIGQDIASTQEKESFVHFYCENSIMVSQNSYVTSVLTSVPANYSTVRKAAHWTRINVCLKGTTKKRADLCPPWNLQW